MKKQIKEVVMLEKYLSVEKLYTRFDQQQAAKTRIQNALKKAGWPLDAAGFIMKYEAEKGNLAHIEGIGPVYEHILTDAANKINKAMKRKQVKKEKVEKPKKK